MTRISRFSAGEAGTSAIGRLRRAYGSWTHAPCVRDFVATGIVPVTRILPFRLSIGVTVTRASRASCYGPDRLTRRGCRSRRSSCPVALPRLSRVTSRWGLNPIGALKVLVVGLAVGSSVFVAALVVVWILMAMVLWLLGGTTD